jgi:hypothetical protein
MRDVPAEIWSTVRPSPLRLAGFLCLVVGAALVGIGASGDWAAIGFVADLERAADVTVRGTDVWEGKVVLLTAAIALIAIPALRLARSSGVRRGIAVALVATGIVALALPVSVAVRPEDRLGGTQGVDLLTERLAAELGLPEDVVREQLSDELRRALRVDVASGVWFSAAGGALLVSGGALSLAWARGRRASDPVFDAAVAQGG